MSAAVQRAEGLNHETRALRSQPLAKPTRNIFRAPRAKNAPSLSPFPTPRLPVISCSRSGSHSSSGRAPPGACAVETRTTSARSQSLARPTRNIFRAPRAKNAPLPLALPDSPPPCYLVLALALGECSASATSECDQRVRPASATSAAPRRHGSFCDSGCGLAAKRDGSSLSRCLNAQATPSSGSRCQSREWERCARASS
jgi:hypothetical protein